MAALRLPSPATSSLLVVDIQERLLPAMFADDQAPVVKHVTNLALLYAELGGHRAYSEQYPRGLGPTVAALGPALEGAARLEKTEFSVLQNVAAGGLGLRPDVVLTGMEAHVCVLQTGLDLLAAGHSVWVPLDAVASRRRDCRDNGLALLERAGATIVNAETLVFAALGRAGTDAFKRFSGLIR